MRRFIAFAAAITLTGRALAQQACTGGQTVPDFGYGFVSCDNCLSSLMQGSVSVQRFTGSPALHQIRADGPGAGVLNEGDTLVAVDGFAITSEAAAIRLATYRTTPVRFALRRNGAGRIVSIVATPVCVRPPASDAAVPNAIVRDAEPQSYSAAVRRGADYERRRGHYGIADSLARDAAQRDSASAGLLVPASPLGLGIECNGCRLESASGRTRWLFSQLPVVAAVDRQSMAANIGLHVGDTLWTIDDTPLTSAIGGELLGALKPVGTFKLGWRRAGKPYSASVTGGRIQSAGPSTGQLSFLQTVGSAQVEVTGRGRLWSRIGVNGELQIQIDSAVVTIRPTPKPPQ